MILKYLNLMEIPTNNWVNSGRSRQTAEKNQPLWQPETPYIEWTWPLRFYHDVRSFSSLYTAKKVSTSIIWT